jgi:hypothetical protein
MSTAVVLTGRPGGTTARAVEVLAGLPPELRLIGGLAVLCRVGVPHRATVDLDALARGLDRYDHAVRSLAVSSTGGGQYVMAGRMELDVIDVSPESAAALLDHLLAQGPLTDLELNAVGHTWAHDTASTMDVSVTSDEAPHDVLARATDRLVASPAGLVVMKATTIPLRAGSRPEKRASDLYDLGRLVAAANGLDGLAEAPDGLRREVGRRLVEWFVQPRGRDRTFRDVRRFDEASLDLDEVADLVVEAGLAA